MKKYVAILLCLSLLIIALVACKNKNDTEETTDTSVVADASESSEFEDEDPDMTEPRFGDDEDNDGKIQINGDNIGTPGGSNAGENWSKPY
jgi:hypothetical protein